MAAFWAVATRGLENVAADEIRARIPDAQTVGITYRRVAFATAVEPSALLQLRSVEDLFVSVEAWKGISRPREALARIQDRALELDLRDAAALCRTVRDIGTPPIFSVTANFVGRRNYSTDEIKAALAGSVETGHGWSYSERDADADLNLRVFIEHELAYIGIRLAARPLNERPYKTANVPGSLKANVAAAMVQLGGFEPGSTVADPLCGAGTIVVEAAMMGLDALGGDADASALEAARRNVEMAGLRLQLQHWDARTLPLPSESLDGIICNLPWGRQVEPSSDLAQFYAACVGEMQRVCRPGARLVLLTSLQPLLRATASDTGLVLDRATEISLSGQTPVISVLRIPS